METLTGGGSKTLAHRGLLSTSSRCPTHSTMGTPSPWATELRAGAPTSRPLRWPKSSATGWRGSSRSRGWRNGQSTSCRCRPSTPSGPGPGASLCGAGHGSQVRRGPAGPSPCLPGDRAERPHCHWHLAGSSPTPLPCLC